MEQERIHIIHPSSRTRANLSRACFSFGFHAEVYSDVSELMKDQLQEGLVLAFDQPGEDGIEGIFEELERLGSYLPIVAMGDVADADRIVASLRAGAIDYLVLPIDTAVLEQRISEALMRAELTHEERKHRAEARAKVEKLTKRERQVLDFIAFGLSNKMIANEIGISPRTVEIHRAHLMTKLQARNAGEVIRLKLKLETEDAYEHRFA